MSQIVEYILTLKDQLSGGITGANNHVNKLESSLVSAKSTLGTLGSMLGTLGVGFAIFKGGEFVHEGVEAFHQLEQATAKVEANLKSTGESAGIGMSDITDMAKNLSKQVQFSRAEVMDMQSQLLTFPSITKDVFEQSMGMVTDIAKQTNHGLSETAIMFGKAFANPEEGLQKLMRYGVMFTDEQKNMVTKLQEGGKLIEAQKYMLDAIATSGYAGVAKAMADADPLFQFNKTMGSVKMTVGELATDLLIKLTPALEIFAKIIKSATDWIKEHGSELWRIIKAIGIGVIAFKTITMVIAPFLTAYRAIAPAAAEAVIGLEATGAATTIALGPIGLLAIGITAVVLAYQMWGTAEEERIASAKALIDVNNKNEEEGIVISANRYHKSGLSRKESFNKSIEDEKESLKARKELNMTAILAADANDHKLSDKLHEDRNTLIQKESTLKDIEKRGLIPIKNDKPKKEEVPPPATKATGSKSVTINVSIKDLVNSLQINTTNLKEGAGKIQDIVANALAGAVNDFQIIAGGH